MVERIAYKGMMGDKVKALSTEEFTKTIKSRVRRALKRNALNYRMLNEKIEEYRKKGIDKPIKTHVREAVIVPQWIGLKFKLYSGKEFQELAITPNMVGRRLGEFIYTTKRVQHSAPGIRATRGSKFLSVK
ncbi:Ribosomal protein S19/S15 [mine drainage metagenome]|uniref:Ribosomal protein S19/S15 n=1 Tax=mine drainage metagenome TaxID=410659 RepID=T1B2Z6_9ZZZZ